MSIKKPKKPSRPLAKNFTTGEFNGLFQTIKLQKCYSGIFIENCKLYHNKSVNNSLISNATSINILNIHTDNTEKKSKYKKLFFTKCKLLTNVEIVFFQGTIVNEHMLNEVFNFIKKNFKSNFRKAELTHGLRNTKMNAKDIDFILEYLCNKKILFKEQEDLIKSVGRPKSQMYKIVI